MTRKTFARLFASVWAGYGHTDVHDLVDVSLALYDWYLSNGGEPIISK